LNRGGNKLDYFLPIDGRLSFAAMGDDTEVVVTLHVMNHAPTGEPKYVVGPEARSGAAEGEYLGIVSVSLPGNTLSTLASRASTNSPSQEKTAPLASSLFSSGCLETPSA
jgi:hypothetical protein